MPDHAERRSVRAVRRIAVHRRSGPHPRGFGARSRASARARGVVRRDQPRSNRRRSAAAGTYQCPTSPSRRRSAGAGGGRLAVVTAGRRHLLGPLLLPYLRPGPGQAPDGARLAVLARRGAGERRTSWTALLDAVRLEPGADLAAVTASQVRDVVERLVEAGQWQAGAPNILVVFDAGYDAPRIAHLLSDLPVEVLGRLRSDRVMRKPVPVPWICLPQGGRPPKHGGEFVFGDPVTWGEATAVTVTNTDRYGTATAQAWDRLLPRLTRRAAWLDHVGPLPIIEGTVIRLTVAKLPSGGVNKPVWLWWSGTGGAITTSTGAGRHSCEGSTWSTRSGCSSRRSAGPGPVCGIRKRPTAGPGSSWPHTHSSASLARSRGTSVGRGSGRRNRTDSPQPE